MRVAAHAGAVAISAACAVVLMAPTAAAGGDSHRHPKPDPITVVASGLNGPRELQAGDWWDSKLYVAESDIGTITSVQPRSGATKAVVTGLGAGLAQGVDSGRGPVRHRDRRGGRGRSAGQRRHSDVPAAGQAGQGRLPVGRPARIRAEEESRRAGSVVARHCVEPVLRARRSALERLRPGRRRRRERRAGRRPQGQGEAVLRATGGHHRRLRRGPQQHRQRSGVRPGADRTRLWSRQPAVRLGADVRGSG